MGDISRRAVTAYEDETYKLGLADNGRLFAAFRTTSGKGSSRATSMAVYLARVDGVREYLDDKCTIPCPDRCTWVSQGKIANRTRLSTRAVRTAEQWLTSKGFIYECACDRMNDGVESTSWWVVDIIGEASALEQWKAARWAALMNADNSDPREDTSPAVDAVVAVEVTAKKVLFKATYGSTHYPTDGRILAMLEGRAPHVPPTKAEAFAGHAAAKAAVAATFTERGVPDAPAVVDELVAARRAAHLPSSAKALRRMLEDGTIEELLPSTVGPVLEGIEDDQSVAYAVVDQSSSLVAAAIAAGAAEMVAAGAVSIADATARLAGFVTAWAPAYTADHDGCAPSVQVLAWAVRDAAAALIKIDAVAADVPAAADDEAPADADAPADDEPVDESCGDREVIVAAAMDWAVSTLMEVKGLSLDETSQRLGAMVAAWSAGHADDNDGLAPSPDELARAIREIADAVIANDATADLPASVDADEPAWGPAAEAPIGLVPAAPPAAPVPAPRPTTPEGLSQFAALQRARACDALIRDHGAVVNDLALRLGVSRDAAAETLRATRAVWLEANVTRSGDEPTADETAAALPTIADGIMKVAA